MSLSVLGVRPISEWRDQGICAQTDPDEFHPDKGDSSATAKRVCNGTAKRAGCPVREMCLAWALANNEHGVWGGTSHHERLVMTGKRKPRARKAKAPTEVAA